MTWAEPHLTGQHRAAFDRARATLRICVHGRSEAACEPCSVGDDGTGHCVGCGNRVDRIDVGCPVCLAALEYLAREDT